MKVQDIKFELMTNNAKFLKSIFELIENVAYEPIITIDEDNIHFNMVDSTGSKGLIIKLSKLFFLNYTLTEKCDICFDMSLMIDILTKCKENDDIVIKGNESNTLITINGKFKMEYEIRNIDVATKKEDIIKEENLDKYIKESELIMPIDTFIDGIEAVCISSKLRKNEIQSFVIMTSENMLTFKVDNKLRGNSLISIPKSDELKITKINDTKKLITCCYNREYMTLVLKFKPVSDVIKIEYTDDIPMIITCKNDKCTIKYFIAPRIDNEQNNNKNE
jgi:hypothetical protein